MADDAQAEGKKEWRQFELLVSRIEAALAPKGAIVTSPDRIVDKVTGQPREVDASIRIQVGSTPILITVECRDRVATQDVTWIEQIIRKKDSIGASATIAVSSTGFTGPALVLARQMGIQTRTLLDVSQAEASRWIEDISISVEFRQWRFTRLELVFIDAPADTQLAPDFAAQIEKQGYEATIAYREADRKPLVLGDVGGQFVQHGMYPPIPGVRPFGVVAPNDGTYLVPTINGDFPLARVQLEVEVTNVWQPIPVRKAFEYANEHGPIVQVAEYAFHVPIGIVTIGLVRDAPPA